MVRNRRKSSTRKATKLNSSGPSYESYYIQKLLLKRKIDGKVEYFAQLKGKCIKRSWISEEEIVPKSLIENYEKRLRKLLNFSTDESDIDGQPKKDLVESEHEQEKEEDSDYAEFCMITTDESDENYKKKFDTKINE